MVKRVNLRAINDNCAETLLQEMISTNYFMNISQITSNFLVRLIFLETRHLRFQFKHKNEPISLRNK